MTKINLFLENIYNDFDKDLSERKVLLNAKKIAKFFLEDNNILKQSCLEGYYYKTITFDIVLCSNDKIQEINAQYRQKDVPTDVITFSLFADSSVDERFVFDDEINLGEIFVSLDKVLTQSEDKGHSFDKELYFLISHGIMHLLGFVHDDASRLDFMLSYQSMSMESLDVKVCKQ